MTWTRLRRCSRKPATRTDSNLRSRRRPSSDRGTKNWVRSSRPISRRSESPPTSTTSSRPSPRTAITDRTSLPRSTRSGAAIVILGPYSPAPSRWRPIKKAAGRGSTRRPTTSSGWTSSRHSTGPSAPPPRAKSRSCCWTSASTIRWRTSPAHLRTRAMCGACHSTWTTRRTCKTSGSIADAAFELAQSVDIRERAKHP